MLQSAGHEVRTAADGLSGLREFERRASDLVVTDIIMPEQEGVETIVALRKLSPQLPIVAISGDPSATSGGYLQIARRLGATRSLEKPFRPGELLDVVEELLVVR